MRAVLVRRDGVALAEPEPADQAVLDAGADGAFEVDPGPRLPYEIPSGRVVVLDEHTGDLLGDLGWIPVPHGPTLPCLAYNIGITLLPSARGRGVGATAQRLLAEHLFASTEVFRVEASTDVANVAEQRALVKAGFRREGLLRGAQQRNGERRDIVLFGLLRTDVAAPDGDRAIVVRRGPVALAQPCRGDAELIAAASDGAFAVDRASEEPSPVPVTVHPLVVIDPDAGELLGAVSWHLVDYGGTLGCKAWNIGIELVPSARGRGIGSAAQRLLVEHLFASTPIDRVEAGTDVANVAEQRALVRAGFQREGVLRGAQSRAGQRHDLVIYGVLRTDL